MSENENSSVGCGPFGIGGFIAVLLSWTTHKSILWAFFHGCINWIYVIYWLFVYWE